MASKSAPQKPQRTRRAKKSSARRIWGRIAVGALAVLVLLGLAGLGAFAYLYATRDLPDPNEDFTTNTTFLFHSDGETQLGSLAVQNRVSLDYEEIPQVVKDAVVAAENRSFWEDPGFSVRGMARGAWSILTGGEIQGGSTITQQYIKIFYLHSGQTISRKVDELVLATKMGRQVPKEEILEGYLNTIYFGRGAYGIEAASKSYFLKPAAELTLQESAALAAILNNPAAFNPSGGSENVERLEGRYGYVLDGMLEMGHITAAEHQEARASLPEFPEVPTNDRYGGPTGFLIKQVERELIDAGFSEGEIQGGGLKVVTTIDTRLQDAAVETAQRYTAEAAANAEEPQDPNELKVAISSVDTASGAVLAMYGGPNYVDDQRNWATTPRAAASTFKAFATLAGLRNGFSLDSILKGDTFVPRGDTQPIRNQFSQEYGPVTLRQAVADSINTAMVDMTEQMEGGPEEVVRAATDSGAPDAGWNRNSRIALGAAEVSPLDMANSYATFADEGHYKDTHFVARVEDRNGSVLYQADVERRPQVERNVAANLTDALTSVVTEGSGTRASDLGRPVAGKTGTHGVEDEIQSAWFVGYTRQISTAVMYVVGDDGIGDLEPYKRPQDRTFYGSSYPLMTWVDYMRVASEGMEVLEFDEPEPIDGINESQSPSPSPTPTETEPTEVESSPTPEESESPTPEESTTEETTPESTPEESSPEPTEPSEEPSPEPEPSEEPVPSEEPPVSSDPPSPGGGGDAAGRPTARPKPPGQEDPIPLPSVSLGADA